MGDRANCYSVEGESGIYFYTHSSGYHLPELVQKGLSAYPSRWDDLQYLNRIIFDNICPNPGETGYGISIERGDNGHPIIVVDSEKQTVGYAKEGDEPECYIKWKFKEFISLDKKELYESYHEDYETPETSDEEE